MKHDQSTTRPCTFNGPLTIEGRSERLTATGRVTVLRETDERVEFSEWLAGQIIDPRDPRLITHPLVEFLRARLYLMAQGHRDQNDSDYLRADAACRLAVSTRRGITPINDDDQAPLTPSGLASQQTQPRLIEMLSSKPNLETLSLAPFEWARRSVHALPGRKER